MLGDEFSLKSSFPNSYPHSNKYLIEFSFAISVKWQGAAHPRGAVVCWRRGIVIQPSGAHSTWPVVVLAS